MKMLELLGDIITRISVCILLLFVLFTFIELDTRMCELEEKVQLLQETRKVWIEYVVIDGMAAGVEL